jgi:hypothetical protein
MSTDPLMNDLLNRAVATVEPRTETLLAGGFARGRTLRRRRRLAQGGSGVALAAMIATVAVAVWPTSGTPTSADTRNRAGGSTAPVSTSVAPTAPQTVAVTPQVVFATFRKLMPHGTITELAGNYTLGDAGTQFVYDDGAGAALVYVSVDSPPTASPIACDIGTCTTRADGTKIGVYHLTDKGPLEWVVAAQRTDGVNVTVTEFNAPAEKGEAEVSRPVPPFSIHELKAVVTNPTWRAKVSPAEADAAAHLFTATQS